MHTSTQPQQRARTHTAQLLRALHRLLIASAALTQQVVMLPFEAGVIEFGNTRAMPQWSAIPDAPYARLPSSPTALHATAHAASLCTSAPLRLCTRTSGHGAAHACAASHPPHTHLTPTDPTRWPHLAQVHAQGAAAQGLRVALGALRRLLEGGPRHQQAARHRRLREPVSRRPRLTARRETRTVDRRQISADDEHMHAHPVALGITPLCTFLVRPTLTPPLCTSCGWSAHAHRVCLVRPTLTPHCTATSCGWSAGARRRCGACCAATTSRSSRSRAASNSTSTAPAPCRRRSRLAARSW